MLHITDILDMPADGGATWTLPLEGTLKGEWPTLLLERVVDVTRRFDACVWQTTGRC